MAFFNQLKKTNRTLLAQLIFTALGFTAMAVLSYLFLSNTALKSLVQTANGVLDFTEERASATFIEIESTLDGFAQKTREMILRGENPDNLQQYIEKRSHFAFSDDKKMSGIQNFFGYFEPDSENSVFMHSSLWDVPGDYQPKQQDWYRMAVEADGGIVETSPYISDTGEVLYICAKCISDEEGKRLGVVCLNVKINLMGQSIVDTAMNQGGYGMLINPNGTVLFHPNDDFIGINMRDPEIPISKYANDIENGVTVFEKPVISWKDENAVVFFRTLANGWHLGLVTPEEHYYASISNMGLTISLLATVLAVTLMVILVRLDMARVRSDEESQLKSAFLANMSHEIRTPINAIVGMTAIGKTANTAERKDYCFGKINDASRHLLGVINDILDMSKIEANKIELSPTDFIFEKMLQQIVNIINFRIDEKHQKLTVYIDKNIPKVLFADDQRLAQVITNLLSNASKFTPEGGSIGLSAHLTDEKDGLCSLRLEVVDDGVGISPEQQAKLFHSFRQAESSTTRKYGGTGLGLAISKSIVEMMGGTIWIQSELGQGSKFIFTVKAKRGNSKKYDLVQHNINWGNIRILTVDDDHHIREYFHEIAKGFGANCEIADGAEEALRLVDKNGAYNIYFVDLKMPGVDGLELTRQIRAKEKNPGNAIVIMISSADLSSIESEAKKAGVDKFLIKPIFPSAIANMISECIGVVNDREHTMPLNIAGIFEGRHILFAEDIDINREIVITLLEPTLVNIDTAENGIEAVKMFMNNPEKYDLIFMDVQMPEMDGYEATRQIRSFDIPHAKDIPIIAMTANVFKEDVERCLEAGMNGHLGKPINMDEILRTMIEYLKAK